jgi:hypothetical protein
MTAKAEATTTRSALSDEQIYGIASKHFWDSREQCWTTPDDYDICAFARDVLAHGGNCQNRQPAFGGDSSIRQPAPVAYVPIHPRTGPLWANTVRSLDDDRPKHYPVMALYAVPLSSGTPRVWLCTCGSPSLPGVLHRADRPCYRVEDQS